MTVVSDPGGHGLDSGAPLAAFGVYQLLERIGTGALGEVYRARDTVHGRTVAIKRVPAALTSDAARLGHLTRTATTLARVSHPGVAMLYECGQYEGELFIAQEFVPGQSLVMLLAGRPIHPRRAVDLAVEIADALGALHAQKITHGDLRPDNVFVTPKGHVKLIDAGLAGFTRGGSIRTSAAKRLGTLSADTMSIVRYLAPEEASSVGADARTDLFALGLLLYEMLTGRPAFDRASADDTLVAVLTATVPAPSTLQPNVPARLDQIVGKSVARALDKRYQTAAAFADDLRAVKAVFDVDLEQRGVAMPAESTSKPARWLLWLAVVLGAAVIAWLLVAR